MSFEDKDPGPSRDVVAAGAETTERWAWVRPLVVRVGVNAMTLLAALIVFSLIRLPGTKS